MATDLQLQMELTVKLLGPALCRGPASEQLARQRAVASQWRRTMDFIYITEETQTDGRKDSTADHE